MPSVLVAPLGAEPQVIPLTTALPALQAAFAAQDPWLRLHKSAKAVASPLNSIYGKLESVFGFSPDVGLKHEFLRRELGRIAEKDRSWLP